MAFTNPFCPSPIYLDAYINQASDPVGYTYQSSDPVGYTYQFSDPVGYTYQSSDPKEYTYQSSDPKGYTYQSSDPEGYTSQSSDPEGYTTYGDPVGHRARKDSTAVDAGLWRTEGGGGRMKECKKEKEVRAALMFGKGKEEYESRGRLYEEEEGDV
ncbi:NBS-LRR type resistance protein [Cucumis melo var. makuwa]|uniref:NBS-LRR type resistance protein n=1 Tax=Cucumis melo var. makuwa TaxID=1194695 RepID=A0A5A7TDR4_CUCMM|nr:NBS-LRR type resistance protein [Cucumis melo var. makuwa]TYJ95531.1 NBS-LRR type resistance protein [Cucumis melo var. makuwa]